MKKVKQYILELMRAAGVFALGRYLTRRKIMIVGWHGVSRTDEHVHFPSLYISKSEFRRRLEFLSRNYTIISLDEATRQLESGKVEPHQVVLTFDDGNYDFFAEAVPILEEFDAPATNYIVTYYAESGEPVWNMLVRYLVALGGSRGASLERAATEGEAGATRRDIEAAWLRRLRATATDRSSREALVAELAGLLDVDLDQVYTLRIMQAMSVEELQSLHERGLDLQLHTHEHFNTVDYFEQAGYQVSECKRRLESWLSADRSHFCYPSGRWTPRVFEILESLGIRSAVTTRPGPNSPATHRYSLRRILNGEENAQIDFEFAMSNIRWLLKDSWRKDRRDNPPPQMTSYMEEHQRAG